MEKSAIIWPQADFSIVMRCRPWLKWNNEIENLRIHQRPNVYALLQKLRKILQEEGMANKRVLVLYYVFENFGNCANLTEFKSIVDWRSIKILIKRVGGAMVVWFFELVFVEYGEITLEQMFKFWIKHEPDSSCVNCKNGYHIWPSEFKIWLVKHIWTRLSTDNFHHFTHVLA